MNKRLIFIGGAPTAGKSTMAEALSKRLSLPWVSTDQIRSTMQAVANKQDYPGLFNASGYDAERFLTELSAEEIVRMEMEQGEEVWLGVEAFVDDWTWKDGGIVEGINILPHLIAKTFSGNTNVSALFLFDPDETRMRQVIYQRGVWGYAHTYADSLKEKEVAWAKLFADTLKQEARQYGYPLIEITKSDQDISRALEVLK